MESFIKDIQSLMLVGEENLSVLDDNTLELNVPTGISFMSDVLKDLPKGVFIDKQVCAVGGTSLAIQSPTNYVIAAHRKILVDNKHKQHSDKLIAVVGGVHVNDIVNGVMLGKNKIITTYDSLGKVSEALKQLGLLDSYHLIVDEVQNVIREGGDFREEVCNDLLNNACKFASVSYLTATSTKRKYLPEQIKNIPYLKIVWEDSVNINVKQKHVTGDLNEVITNICLSHLDGKTEGEAYFFFNSVKGLIPIIKNLMNLRKVNSKDIKVICADTDENYKVLSSLGKKFVPEVPVEGVNKDGSPIVKNKPITFVTKTCFEGVDFYSDNPITYVVSDARNKHKHFVKTDIAVDIRQNDERLLFQSLNLCISVCVTIAVFFLCILGKRRKSDSYFSCFLNIDISQGACFLRKIHSYNLVTDFCRSLVLARTARNQAHAAELLDCFDIVKA